MVVLLAVLGLVIDVGELYLTQRHLQTAADSAALAAAQDLPNSSSNACSYSASPAGATTCTVDGTNVLLAPSGANYNSRYGNVQTSAAVECLFGRLGRDDLPDGNRVQRPRRVQPGR